VLGLALVGELADVEARLDLLLGASLFVPDLLLVGHALEQFHPGRVHLPRGVLRRVAGRARKLPGLAVVGVAGVALPVLGLLLRGRAATAGPDLPILLIVLIEFLLVRTPSLPLA